MQKRSSNRQRHVALTGHLPGRAEASGPRSSAERVLSLVDTNDPAWPSIAAVLREFLAAEIELDEHSVHVALKLGRQRATLLPAPDASGKMGLAAGTASIVYYVRRGSLIKIGTTTRPRHRFTALLPDEILAFEPGGRELERARHLQFRHLRASGEFFRDDPELRLHAFQVRAMYGDPDPAWSSTVVRRWQEADLSTVETMTAAEAESELGIRNGTLRVWVHRGLISRVGTGDRGRAHYRRDHLIALRDSPATRMREQL